MNQPRIFSLMRADARPVVALIAAALLVGAAAVHAQTSTEPAATVPPSAEPAATAPPAAGEAPAASPQPEIRVIDGQLVPGADPTGAPAGEEPVEFDPNAKYPIAEVDNPRFEFGETWMGASLEHAFTIRNTGDAPLKILRVKPGCGCTVAGKYPEELAPGEKGELPFKLNTARMNGKFTKSISVSTNDPKNRQMQLLLSGEVKQFVEMEPKVVQFGRVKPDTVVTNKVTLTNNTKEDLDLSIDSAVDLKCFTAKIEETVPGKQFELTVTAQPPFDIGINRINIPLKTNVKEQPTIDVTCIATLPQRIEFRPDKIQIAGSSRAESERRVLLTNNGDEPLHIVSVSSTDPRLTVESSEIEPGQKYQLAVKIPANYGTPESDTAIVIKTDDAKDSELRVPVLGRATPSVEQPQRPAMTMLGQPAPEAKATAVNGQEVTVGGKHDKVQFVTFYASWCGFCKKALPKIEELQKKYEGNSQVEILAINLDDRSGRRARTEEESLNHYKEMGLTMPMVMDNEKDISRPYKVSSFPTMFVIGKTGEIEAVHVGAAVGFENTVTTEIETLLAGKTRADFPAAPAPAAGEPTRIPIHLTPAEGAAAPPDSAAPAGTTAPATETPAPADSASKPELQDPTTPE